MREDLNTEFKREYTEDIKYAVLAFANTDGGTVYVGLDDDGKPCGIEDIDDSMLRLTNMVRDSIHPDISMFTECRIVKIDDKEVLALRVLRGTARPYYLHSKGIRPAGVYVRQGASSVPASESAILQMIRETGNESYERERSLKQELTFNKMDEFFRMKDLSCDMQKKRNLKLIGEDGTWTNLAFLMSDQCTQQIKLATFQGTEKTIFLNRTEISGSVLDQAEKAYDWISVYNETRAEFEGIHRKDIRNYPEVAIREALLNTIVHRDYSIDSPIQISILEDRIEMVSPGGLPQGIEFDDLALERSQLRNPDLGNIFYRLQLIEAYGTGLSKIRRAYHDSGLEPEISASSHTFKVVLPNINTPRETAEARKQKDHDQPMYLYDEQPPYITKRERAVLDLVQKKGKITRRDVDSLLSVSQTTSSLLLRQMVDSRLISRSGNGPSSVYMLYKRTK